MIRPAVPGDAPGIFPLLCQLEGIPLPSDDFARCFSRCLSSPSYHCFVEEDGGSILGFISLRIEEQLHHLSSVAEVMEMIVGEPERGKSIGQRLFDYAKAYASEQGCSQLEVSSNRLRESAHRFYRRQGLEETHCKFTMKL